MTDTFRPPVFTGADLAGRRALITGAARGIGLAVAQRFAAGGATVAIADLDLAAAQAAADTVGNGAIAIECDVRDNDAVEAAVAATVDQLGGLEVLVNNAGIEVAKPIVDTTEEDFVGLIDINVNGMFRCTKAAFGALAESGRGAIVNLSSVAGTGGTPLLSAYSASKAAVVRLTEVTALEGRPVGVRANAVCPGLIGTAMAERLVAPLESVAPMTFDEIIALKQGRLGTPDEIAEMIAFLSADEAKFITGMSYLIDGGLTASLF